MDEHQGSQPRDQAGLGKSQGRGNTSNPEENNGLFEKNGLIHQVFKTQKVLTLGLLGTIFIGGITVVGRILSFNRLAESTIDERIENYKPLNKTLNDHGKDIEYLRRDVDKVQSQVDAWAPFFEPDNKKKVHK